MSRVDNTLLPKRGEIRNVGKEEYFLELPKKFMHRFEQALNA
jgi:hypothetical protein